MTINNELKQDAEELGQATGLKVNLTEEGPRVFVLIHQVPLPQGLFKLSLTDILFTTDHQYRLSALDMFWTDLDVVRPDGSIPKNAGTIETYLGRQWRRFSWHPNQASNLARNGLLDHFAFMEARWVEEVKG